MSAEQFQCDAVVIGAGAVGLAVARALALDGRETIILEKNAHFGMETSSRNSEVIHAGIYYPKGSLKALLCVEGKRRLYDFCESHGVGFKRLGKLIVATHADQGAGIETILTTAANNGVGDLKRLGKAEIAALEPELFATEGLFSPSTGIIDSHQYMLALLGDAEGAGASMVRDAEVTAIVRETSGYCLTVRNAGQAMRLSCRILVNSAGLWAQHVAGLIDALDRAHIPPLFLAKGNYVTLTGKSPFRHLVYPVPEHGGLGVHLTLDMGGGARFGPNVEWLDGNDPDAIDYTVSPGMPGLFAPRIAQYWPAVTESALAPGYCGVRPKTTGPRDPNADFRIDGPGVHGLPGLVNLFGIESPGLTASLAIAEHVREFLDG
ncbi:MAG: FAD-dependent oxidoreductase [Alphaproteobacteria bacterium 64-11]|nr:NAD(P)/FAD-dependent oxidoreductase [Alphaproteobacteria bacterium]OJU12947.1 MAG: FAD-dependent oxidoreductase [Alphaproteobacteria bacterium 64-11]